ncbi:MAG: hypothetical protein ABIO02_00695 [Patescibacteria group bacterium]
MQNNVVSKVVRYLPWIIFGLIFLILLIPVLNLRLFLDDHVLVFPALTHTYLQDFKMYTHDFGLYRPFRLVFLYYPLYTLYSFVPWAPFLILFSLHVATGILIFQILKKYLDDKLSLILGISFIVFPFFTEQYGWIATGTTLVNFIIFLQIYIALVSKISVKAKIIWLFVLQLIGAFTYDTIFFNFILLGFLLFKKKEAWDLTKKQIGLFTLLFAIPSILYAFLRSAIFYPHNHATLREIQLSDLPNMLSIQSHNLSVFFSSQQFLFLGKGSWMSFWQKTFMDGFNNLIHSPLSLLLLNYIVVATIGYIVMRKREAANEKIGRYNIVIIILGLVALLSLAPSFLVTIPSFPFRVMALTYWSVLAVILIYLHSFSKQIAQIVGVAIIFAGLIFSVQMLQGMRQVYNDDDRMTTQIVKGLDEHMQNGQKATVVLENMPYSTNTVYNYGEYLASCVRTDWCVQMELAKKTDKVQKVIVNPTTPPQEKGLVHTFSYNEKIKGLEFKK